MFSLLETEQEIATAQRKLEATLKRDLPRTAVKDIGYPSGRENGAKVQTDGTYWFWSADFAGKQVPNPRRLNWFGLLGDGKALSISVEINTPYKERNDQVAGFFARDSRSGRTYLFHSGRVGGGTKGVGKAAFLAWSGLGLIEVVDSSGEVKEGVLVMPVDGPGASRSALHYVDAIVGFKIAVREGEITKPSFQEKLKQWGDFYAEGRGRRRGSRSSEIDYISRHGEVVDAVAAWRGVGGLPKGSRLVKDVLIDLGVSTGHGLTEVFEVKTSAARPQIYAAIGQLLVHGSDNACRRFIVLPHDQPITDDLGTGLRRLGIEILLFKLDEAKATILSTR